MRLPNFLIVGAAKAGTTSLYRYLQQHPQVFVSPTKEPFFFSFMGKKPDFAGPHDAAVNKEIVTDMNSYQALFNSVKTEKMIGECSNSYLYFPNSAENIKKYIPDCKIIIILRNPVERAFSHHLQATMLGHEHLSFEESLAKAGERQEKNWRWHYQYVLQGMYYQQVKRYIENFGRDQIFVGLFDDLKKDTPSFVKSVLHFLDIDTEVAIDFEAHNQSGLPKNQKVHQFLRSPNFIKKMTKPFTSEKLRGKIYHLLQNKNYKYDQKPVMSADTRQQLQQIFYDDILQLQSLIQKDLSGWLASELISQEA